ncbi:MAG: tetratricopeptide repeat protein [Bacteroidia bacterium]
MQRNLKIITTIFCGLLLVSEWGFAQSPVTSYARDTLEVKALLENGLELEGHDPDSAIRIYEQALALSKKINYTRGVISYYTHVTYVYNYLGRADTALTLNLESVRIARAYGDPERLAACLHNVAVSFEQLNQYDSAIAFYLNVAEMMEKRKSHPSLSLVYANIAHVYHQIHDYPRALNYAENSVRLARQSGDKWNLLIALNNYALPLIKSGRYEPAISSLKEAITICRQTDDKYKLNTLLANLGDVYLKSGKTSLVYPVYLEGYQLAESVEDPNGMCIHHRGLGYYFLDAKDWDKAQEYTLKALHTARKHNLQNQLEHTFLLLSDIYLGMGQMDNYYRYRAKSDSVSELLISEELRKNVQDLEMRYSTRFQQQQIEELKKASVIQKYRNRINQFLLILTAGIGLILAIVIVFILRTSQQKRKIMEKEKLWLASEAVLRGQEEERKRLAREIHDGLGGMMAGIGFAFRHMRENLRLTPEEKGSFDRNLDMLDSASRELRRVAHDLMPESLLHFGLETSLADLCREISGSGVLQVTYQSFGLENMKTDASISLTVYRIVQELLANTIRHANADSAIIQLIFRDKKLLLIAEDNGIGFDTRQLEKSVGMGWKNIISRISYLGGKWEIFSEINKGTTFTAEFTPQI